MAFVTLSNNTVFLDRNGNPVANGVLVLTLEDTYNSVMFAGPGNLNRSVQFALDGSGKIITNPAQIYGSNQLEGNPRYFFEVFYDNTFLAPIAYVGSGAGYYLNTTDSQPVDLLTHAVATAESGSIPLRAPDFYNANGWGPLGLGPVAQPPIPWGSEPANEVLAGPTSGAAQPPTFRALVNADLPALVNADLPNPLNGQDIVQNSSMTAFGDSITQCVNQGSGPNAPTQNSECYWDILATEKAWTPTNAGISGSGITDAGQMDSILATTVAANSVSTELCCVNDMRNNGVGGITGSTQQSAWQSSVEGALLWLATPDSSKIKANGSSVTYSGTWTSPGTYGGLVLRTLSAGATASFNVYGSSVYVASLWQVGNTSTYTINVDGTIYPTIATSTGSYTTLQGRGYGLRIFRISGLSEGVHGVILTAVTADANNPVYFVFAVGATGQPTKTGPYVFIGNTLRFTASGYSNFGGSDAIVSEFNELIRQTVADLASDGLHVQLVDASGYYTPNSTNTQSDGVHPTIIGHTILASAFENEMIGYLTPSDRGTLRIWRNLSPCVMGGSFAIGGCLDSQDFSKRASIASIQAPTEGTLFLGSDGSGIQRNTTDYNFTTASGSPILQLNGTQIASSNLGDVSGWTNYSPTAAPTVGAFGSVSATGRYFKIGRLVQFTVAVTITTNGTGSGFVNVSLPFAAGTTSDFIVAGRESVSTGLALAGQLNAGGTTMTIAALNTSQQYDAYPGANGYKLELSGFYESAS